MKTRNTIVILLALITATGCSSTQVSSTGGTAPTSEAFSITAPKSYTVKQGSTSPMTVTLNRGGDFKRDVQMDINVQGLSITPSYVLVKASDKPNVDSQLTVARDAAIGDYRVTVTGTPTIGDPTSTVFTVTVAAQ